MAEAAGLISIRPVLLCRHRGYRYGALSRGGRAAYFKRGYDAHDSFYDPGRGDDPCGRPGYGSTLRSPLPGLPTEVGVGRQQRHLLQLCIMGAVPHGGVGTLGHVLGQPVLAAGTSGVAGPPL
jgi:hypothetical protein